MVQFFEKLAKHLLVWGSEPVIAAINRWRAVVAVDAGSPASLFAYEDLLFAIREDLGNDRKTVQRGDLLRVFVNDIDEFLPERDDDAGDDDIRLAA